jgi:hypothetical protein
LNFKKKVNIKIPKNSFLITSFVLFKPQSIFKIKIMNMYEVEKIVDKKIVEGTPRYLIKWVGYMECESTWEPAENLTNCKEMLQRFEDRLRKKRARPELVSPKKGRYDITPLKK